MSMSAPWHRPRRQKGRTSALLDKKVRLDNGDEVTFRDEIERALRRMQVNDGFLLQFVPRPAVEEDVNRRMRRIAQITDQILPAMVPARRTGTIR